MECSTVVSVKAIINYKSKFLIVQRHADDEVGADTWEFPGGKLDFGEDLECAVLREVKEETNLEVAINRLLYASTFMTHEHRQLVVLSYLCKSDIDAVQLSNEHQGYMWADKKQLKELLHKSTINDLTKHSAWRYITNK